MPVVIRTGGSDLRVGGRFLRLVGARGVLHGEPVENHVPHEGGGDVILWAGESRGGSVDAVAVVLDHHTTAVRVLAELRVGAVHVRVGDRVPEVALADDRCVPVGPHRRALLAHRAVDEPPAATAHDGEVEQRVRVVEVDRHVAKQLVDHLDHHTEAVSRSIGSSVGEDALLLPEWEGLSDQGVDVAPELVTLGTTAPPIEVHVLQTDCG